MKYARLLDRFDDPSLMVLVFLVQFLVFYKAVNARGARSLNICPCFAVDILEMKPKRKQWLTVTTKMQTSTGIEF